MLHTVNEFSLYADTIQEKCAQKYILTDEIIACIRAPSQSATYLGFQARNAQRTPIPEKPVELASFRHRF